MRSAETTPSTTSRIRCALAVLIACGLTVLALGATAIVAPAEAAYADALTAQAVTTGPSWSLAKTSITLKSYANPGKIYLNNYDGYEDLDASSNAYSIVDPDIEWDTSAGKYYVSLQKKGVGKAIVTVRDYDTDAYRTINVNCTPADFKLYTGNFTFQKSTSYTSSLYVSAQGESDSDGNYYDDAHIVKAVSSNPKVATVKVESNSYSGTTYSHALITPQNNGSTKITYTDQHGRKLTYTITVKANYWKPNLKNGTWVAAPYGEKKITVWTKPKAKVTVKIGGETHVKKADKNGKAPIKLSSIYKVKTKIKVTAKTSKATATKTDKVYSSGYCSSYGYIYSCRYYVPVKVSNAHKGDYLIVKCGSEKHKVKTFKSKTSSWSGYAYMKKTLRNYSYRTIKIVLYNKFGQKLHETTRTPRF